MATVSGHHQDANLKACTLSKANSTLFKKRMQMHLLQIVTASGVPVCGSVAMFRPSLCMLSFGGFRGAASRWIHLSSGHACRRSMPGMFLAEPGMFLMQRCFAQCHSQMSCI
jgi:hypothetical protein